MQRCTGHMYEGERQVITTHNICAIELLAPALGATTTPPYNHSIRTRDLTVNHLDLKLQLSYKCGYELFIINLRRYRHEICTLQPVLPMMNMIMKKFTFINLQL